MPGPAGNGPTSGLVGEAMQPTPSRLPTGSGMAAVGLRTGIGVKQRCIRVEFNLGHSNRIELRGALAEDPI